MVRKAGLWCALMGGVWMAGGAPALAADTAAVIETYADVAHAKYEDALTTAEALEAAIDTLIAKPTEDNLKAARTAWLAARDPYQQTEGYRFGNPIVDDWEGKVNAWPLDEGLIDYVAEAYGTESDDNPLYTANVIANTSITFGGETIDTSKITKELLADKLHEVGGLRGERRHRLPRHRVPAVGPGPERHRPGRRQPSRPPTTTPPTAPTAIATAAPSI